MINVTELLPTPWTSSHQYGDCLIIPTINLFYVNIPKNSSSWCKKYLTLCSKESSWHGAGGHTTINVDQSVYENIIVLRHPRQRWLSQRPFCDKVIAGISLKEINQFAIDMLDVIKDEHAAPQVSFIRGVDVSKTTWFECGSGLANNMYRFFEDKFNCTTRLDGRENQSHDTQEYQDYRRAWKELYKNPTIKKVWDYIYQDDLDLYKNVNFYIK